MSWRRIVSGTRARHTRPQSRITHHTQTTHSTPPSPTHRRSEKFSEFFFGHVDAVCEIPREPRSCPGCHRAARPPPSPARSRAPRRARAATTPPATARSARRATRARRRRPPPPPRSHSRRAPPIAPPKRKNWGRASRGQPARYDNVAAEEPLLHEWLHLSPCLRPAQEEEADDDDDGALPPPARPEPALAVLRLAAATAGAASRC